MHPDINDPVLDRRHAPHQQYTYVKNNAVGFNKSEHVINNRIKSSYKSSRSIRHTGHIWFLIKTKFNLGYIREGSLYKRLRLGYRHATITGRLCLLVGLLIIGSVTIYLLFNQPNYRISAKADLLLASPDKSMLHQVSDAMSKQEYFINRNGMKPVVVTIPKVAVGQPSTGLYSAVVPYQLRRGLNVVNNSNHISLSLVPLIQTSSVKWIDGHFIYSARSGIQMIYTPRKTKLTEDIIINHPQGNSLILAYHLGLPSGYTAVTASDGNILIGSGGKTLFELPPPVIKESNGKKGGRSAPASVRLRVAASTLTLSASGLTHLSYPIVIDPSIIVNSTINFLTGNNEGDIAVGTNQISESGLSGGSLKSWNSTSSLPQALFRSASVTYNGYVYVLGGDNDSGVAQSTVYYAQLSNNGIGSWNSAPNLPQGLFATTADTYDGFLYAIGGASSSVYFAQINSNGSLVSTLTSCPGGGTLTNGTWCTTSYPMTSAVTYASSAVYNGYIYLMGGCTSTCPLNSVYYAPINADGSIGTWQTTAVLPTAINSFAVAYNGYLYLVGGYTASGLSNYAYYAPINANGSLGNWVRSAYTLPQAMDQLSVMVYDGYLYALGGTNGSGPQSTSYYAPIYSNGSTGSWNSTSNLAVASAGQNAVVYNGYIYLFGGGNGNSPVSQSFSYTGSSQTYTIPSGVSEITVTAYGAQGGSIDGGLGGETEATMNVSSGQTWTVYVGGQGTLNATGAYPGGGAGGYYLATGSSYGSCVAGDTGNYGGGGGGYSGAYLDAGNEIIAGGGGGGGPQGYGYPSNGGGGGGGSGAAGSYSPNPDSTSYKGTPGGGGTTSAGGAAGTNYSGLSETEPTAGSTGQGGSGGIMNDQNCLYNPGGGGGGGGGYYGGGGGGGDYEYGSGAGGGGGSGYLAGGTLVASNSGVQSGNGSVIIGYNQALNDAQYVQIEPAGMTNGYVASANSLTYPTKNTVTVVYEGYLYEIGGCNTQSCPTGDVLYAPINATGGTGSWSATTALTVPVFDEAAFAYNGYMYVVGGDNGSSSITNCYYTSINSSTGALGSTWTTTTSIPSTPGGFSQGSFQVYNGYLYLLGGFSSGDAVYDDSINSSGGLNNSWTATTSLPSANSQYMYSASAVYGGYIYILGGTTTTDNVYYAEIDSSNGQLDINNAACGQVWCSTTSLTYSPGIQSASAVAYNGYIYLLGGYTGSATASTVYAPIASNGSLGSWSSNTALPQPIYNGYAVTDNGYLYYVGGYNGTSEFSTVSYAQFNNGGPGTVQNWSSTSSLLAPIDDASPVAYNGYIYNIGGQSWNSGTGSYTELNTTEYASIANNGALSSWTTLSNAMPTAVQFASAVAYNGYIYDLGGCTDTNCTNSLVTPTVQYTSINSNGTLGTWSTTSSLPYPMEHATSVVYNGYIYEIGGVLISNGSGYYSTEVYYAKIDIANGKLDINGSCGQIWCTTNGVTDYTAGSVVYNGYIYEIGGSSGSSVEYTQIDSNNASLDISGPCGSVWCPTASLPTSVDYESTVAYDGYVYSLGNYFSNAVFYAPINNNGTLGEWRSTTGLPAANDTLSAVAYNGNVYDIGGWPGGGATANVYYAGLSSIPRIGQYSALLNLSNGYNVTPVAITIDGSNNGNPGIGGTAGIGGLTINYRGSDSSCMTLSSSQSVNLIPPELVTPFKLAIALDGCGNPVTFSNYFWLHFTLDDSQTGTFPDVSGNHTTVTGYQIFYHPNAAERLRGGMSLQNGAQQSLDAPPTPLQ